MAIEVSLTIEPEILVESAQTNALLNFSLSEPPPTEGIIVTVNTTDISEFNLSQTQVSGGEIILEDELVEQLETNLDQTRTEEVPGAAVAIVSPWGSWFGASGVANLENNIPLQPGDRFEIGSITKTFVATTVLQLVEEGVLSLEDTLTDWLPETVTADLPNAAEITIKQLLQHTSGVADYVDLLFDQAATNPAVFVREWQPEELVDLIDTIEPLFEPGDSWHYSNTNYILAGLVVETATENNIAGEIRDRILDPLDLNNTFFAEEEEIPGGYISGYWDFDQNGTLDNINIANLSWAWATGAMVSNTEDLDTFARSLFVGDLLQPETLSQMLDTVPAINNNNYSSYGLGVGTIESPNRFWYIHRGQTLGYRSNMWYSPQDDLTYIELINGFSADNLVRDLLPAYREGTTDDSFNFTITEQQAQIILPIADDSVIEAEETVTFSLETGEEYEVDSNANSGTFTIVDTSEPTSEPIFGTLDGDVIEVVGNNQLVFTGDSDDLIDLSLGGSNHRVYAGFGDDTLILGGGSRVVGGEGRDRFFVSDGGDNTITGGADADGFWIATAEIPDAVNIITDFTDGEDVLGIVGVGIGFEDIHITQIRGDALISANGSDLAILLGVDSTNLSAKDFTFA